MNNRGHQLKILAVWLAIIACTAMSIAHFISLEYYDNELNDLKENIEDHEDLCSYDDPNDCSSCESFQESKKQLQNSVTTLWTSYIAELTLFIIFSSALFGIGEIVENTGNTAYNSHAQKNLSEQMLAELQRVNSQPQAYQDYNAPQGYGYPNNYSYPQQSNYPNGYNYPPQEHQY